MIGENQTGNVSINQYDRKQYLQDIALMKKLGVNTYRFSLSWARLIPEGTGKINQKGIDHYITFLDDLTANGIEPMVTLYHWDMPQALQEKGGWLNPLSVQWFEEYSNLVFKSFGNKVKKYITFNEPYIENFLFAPLINNVIDKKIRHFCLRTNKWQKEPPRLIIYYWPMQKPSIIFTNKKEWG
jgi:beta-glucosidase